jgi:hypothetical protein
MTHAEWYNLPLNVREIFYNIASKASEGNAMDWLNHLVPAHVHNNPADIKELMGLKDVSRIVSGENGGEYTYENTILEDRSVNRGRGDGPDGKHADMTEQELADARLDLKSDAELIDSATPSDVDLAPVQEVEVTVFGDPTATTMTVDPTEASPDILVSTDADAIAEGSDFFASYISEADTALEAAEAATLVASTTAVEVGAEAIDFFAVTGEVIGQIATPVVLAMKTGRAFSNDPDEQAGAAVCVGTIASIGMFTPAAPLIGIGALGWTIWGLGQGFINWMNNDPQGTPVKW